MRLAASLCSTVLKIMDRVYSGVFAITVLHSEFSAVTSNEYQQDCKDVYCGEQRTELANDIQRHIIGCSLLWNIKIDKFTQSKLHEYADLWKKESWLYVSHHKIHLHLPISHKPQN